MYTVDNNIQDFIKYIKSANFDENELNYTLITSDESETELLAATLAENLSLGKIIALEGDLGAGKTVFSRGFANGLKITEPISSPTFTIVQEYQLTNYKTLPAWLFHLDLYRLDGYHAALAFGIEEFLNEANAFTLIEWPVRIKELLTNNFLRISITHFNETQRKIAIKHIV